MNQSERKVVPLLKEVPHHEGIQGSGSIALCNLNVGNNGGEWLASCPSHFTPSTHWIGGWMAHRASSDTVVKRKITARN